MLTHRVAYNPHIHISQNLIALVNALIVAKPQIPYSKTPVIDSDLAVSLPAPSTDAREIMIARMRAAAQIDPEAHRVVLINPNASELLPHRRWMPARYAELIKRIIGAISGRAGADHRRAQRARRSGSAWRRNAGRAASRSPAIRRCRELPALYSLAKLMVTNDSGPSHFAAASGLQHNRACSVRRRPSSISRSAHRARSMPGSPARPASAPPTTARPPAPTMSACRPSSVDEVFAAVAEEMSRHR